MSIIINGHYFRKKTSKHGLKISPIERITVLNISEDTAKVAKGHLAEGEKSQYIFDMKIDKIIEKPTTADYKLLVKEDKVKAKEKEHRSINGITYKRLMSTNNGKKKSTIIYINEKIKDIIVSKIENGRNLNQKIVPAKLESYYI